MIGLFVFFLTPFLCFLYGLSHQSSLPFLQTELFQQLETFRFTFIEKTGQTLEEKNIQYFQDQQTGEQIFLEKLTLDSPVFNMWSEWIDSGDNERMKKCLKLETIITSDALNTLCYFAIQYNVEVISEFILIHYPHFKPDIFSFQSDSQSWQSLLHFFISTLLTPSNNSPHILSLLNGVDFFKLQDRSFLSTVCQNNTLNLLLHSGATLLPNEMDVMKYSRINSLYFYTLASLVTALSDTEELNDSKKYGTQLSASIRYSAFGFPSVYELFFKRKVHPDDTGKNYKNVQVHIANGVLHGSLPVNKTLYYENSLQWASWSHYSNGVQKLLEYGASPLFKNYQGRIPLHFVMLPSRYRNDNCIFGVDLENVLDSLLNAGSNVNTQDAWGMTPPMLMVVNAPGNDYRSFLRNFHKILVGVNPDIVDCRNWTLWDTIRLNRRFEFEEEYLKSLPLPSTADNGHFLGLPLPLQKHLIDIAQNCTSLMLFEDSQYEGLDYKQMREFAQRVYYCNQENLCVPIHNKTEAKLFFAMNILPQDKEKYVTESFSNNHLTALEFLDNPHDILFIFSRLITDLCQIGTLEELTIRLFRERLLDVLPNYLKQHSTENFLKSFFRKDLHMNDSYLLILCQTYLIEPTNVDSTVIQFSKEIIEQFQILSQKGSISNRANYYLSLWGDQHTLLLDRIVDEMFKDNAGLLFPLLLFVDNTIAPLILDSYENKSGRLPLYNSDVDKEFRWIIFLLLFRKIALLQGNHTENFQKQQYQKIVEEKKFLLDSIEGFTHLESLLPQDRELEYFGRSISWKDDKGLYHHVKFRKEKETDEEFLGIARLNCAIDQGQLWTRGFQKGISGFLTPESTQRIGEIIRMSSEEMKTKDFQAGGEFYHFVVEHPNYNAYLDPMNYEGSLEEFSLDLSDALFCLADSIKNGVPVHNLSELNHDDTRKTNFSPFFQYISWGVHGQGQIDFSTNEDNNPFKYVNLSTPFRKNDLVLGGLRDLDEIKNTLEQNREAFGRINKGVVQAGTQKLMAKQRTPSQTNNLYQEALSMMECLETANWMLLKLLKKDFYVLHHMSIEKTTELFLSHYRSFLKGFGYPDPDRVLNAIQPSIQADLTHFKSNPEILHLTVPRAAGRDSQFQNLFMASCYTTTCLARFRIESHLSLTSTDFSEDMDCEDYIETPHLEAEPSQDKYDGLLSPFKKSKCEDEDSLFLASVMGCESQVCLEDFLMSEVIEQTTLYIRKLLTEQSDYLPSVDDCQIQVISLSQAQERDELKGKFNSNLMFQNVKIVDGVSSKYIIIVSDKAKWYFKENLEHRHLSYETSLMNELFQIEFQIKQTTSLTKENTVDLEHLSWIKSLLWISQTSESPLDEIKKELEGFYQTLSTLEWKGSLTQKFLDGSIKVAQCLKNNQVNIDDFINEELVLSLERVQYYDDVRQLYVASVIETQALILQNV